jgi:hypothetical protein
MDPLDPATIQAPHSSPTCGGPGSNRAPPTAILRGFELGLGRIGGAVRVRELYFAQQEGEEKARTNEPGGCSSPARSQGTSEHLCVGGGGSGPYSPRGSPSPAQVGMGRSSAWARRGGRRMDVRRKSAGWGRRSNCDCGFLTAGGLEIWHLRRRRAGRDR